MRAWPRGWLLLGALSGVLAPEASAQDAGFAPLSPARADAGPQPRTPTDLTALAKMAGDQMRMEARARNDAALADRKRKDYPKALRGFREAHELDPADPEIANNVAFLSQLLGNRAEAEKMYRLTLRLDPDRKLAHFNLAELLVHPDASDEALAEAASLLSRARELDGNSRPIVRLQARVAARTEDFKAAARYYETLGAHPKAAAADFIEIGDFHRGLGQAEVALQWYRKVDEGSDQIDVAVSRIREIEVEREARRYGWTRPLDAIPDNARTLAERARALAQQGQEAEAERLLGEAIALAPRFGAAHLALGELLAHRDDAGGAELSFLRAHAVDNGDAETMRRLADFYLRSGRAAEAVFFLTRVLQVRPDWINEEFDLALAWQAAGDPQRALAHVERFLNAKSEDAPDERVDKAKAFRATLLRSLPAPISPLPEVDGDQALMRAVNRARALAVKGSLDDAMAELRSLPEAQRGTSVRNLEGRIMQAAGRWDEAAEAFVASLRLDRKQPETLEQLAAVRIHQERTPEARDLLNEAVAAGSRTARFLVVQLDARRVESDLPDWLADLTRIRELRRAREALLPLVEGGQLPRFADDAAALLTVLDARIRSAYVAAAVGIFVLVLPLGLGAWRLWGGIDLALLVARHPESGPEVQRTLAAIRHEVLKHNTMLLTGLVDAIDADKEVGTDARWCRNSLLGEPDGTGRDDCAERRLTAYADRLMQLGRAHGEHLNLRRKDPALSALLRGFRVLRRNAKLFDRADQLGNRGLQRLAKVLGTATQLLNVQGYEAVRGLLDSLRVLAVDEDLLRAVYDRTRHEPAFADADAIPLEVTLTVLGDAQLPVRVAMPRHDFEDVLANLIRNALQSSLRHDDREVAIGIAVDAEVDMITGLERVLFLIQDTSPQRLTSEMLRGRYIEAGLGLTADIVSRYEGTLDVVAQPDPWAKAVVVKLPVVDDAEEV